MGQRQSSYQQSHGLELHFRPASASTLFDAVKWRPVKSVDLFFRTGSTHGKGNVKSVRSKKRVTDLGRSLLRSELTSLGLSKKGLKNEEELDITRRQRKKSRRPKEKGAHACLYHRGRRRPGNCRSIERLHATRDRSQAYPRSERWAGESRSSMKRTR